MRLEAHPSISMEQRGRLFDAAIPELREQLLADATNVVAESVDGATLTITSDKLNAPKIVAVKGE